MMQEEEGGGDGQQFPSQWSIENRGSIHPPPTSTFTPSEEVIITKNDLDLYSQHKVRTDKDPQTQQNYFREQGDRVVQ